MAQEHHHQPFFDSPELIADLIRGSVQADWVPHFDFGTLERVGSSYIENLLRDIECDVIWKLRFKGEPFYVYMLMALQPRIDRYMALRMLVCVALLYEDMIREEAASSDSLLPPVLPIIVCDADSALEAPQTLGEPMAFESSSLQRCTPKLRYRLVDAGCFVDDEFEPLRNVAVSLLQIEIACTPQTFEQANAVLGNWLAAPALTALEQTFMAWLTQALLPDRLPGVDFCHVKSLRELQNLFAEHSVEWSEQWQQPRG